MIHRAFALLTLLLPLLVGCSPELKVGHFACEEVSDCPTDWFCWSNGRCYDTPEMIGGDGSIPGGDASEPSDATTADSGTDGATDGALVDGRVPDARVDTGVIGDSGLDEDGGLEDGAVPDAGCVTTFGELCDAPGLCGARISCSGECTGGISEPRCNCGALVCQGDGTWSECRDPTNLGQSCSDATVCGGTIDCDGACTGGSPMPNCQCGPATCNVTGAWVCPGPSNLGQTCDGPNVCGGSIDCSGECRGGSPLPTCQCGTPTCGGCVGGTCGNNSTCREGACVCNSGACTCPASGVSSCDLCLPNGNIGTCSLDAYDCGSLGATQLFCAFGCSAGPPPVCQCSPETGNSCFTETCNCFCGSIPNFGNVDCDGNCIPVYPSCAEVCFEICGQICPFPPCPI